MEMASMSENDRMADILKRLKRLEDAVFSSSRSDAIEKKRVERANSIHSKIDFSLNEKHFIKTHANEMSGPKKFTLLLAFIVKGRLDESVETNVIKAKWNKMKAKNLMGYAFNSKYPNEAKTAGWVDSKKHGTYHLRASWMKIFS